MDVSDELGRVIAEHDQELAVRAAELERKMKDAVAEIRRKWVELAGRLYEFWRISGWEALGYDTAAEWLAQPEIELSRSQAHTLVEAYREFVVYRGIDPDRLGRVELSKVQLALPAVRREQVEPERAIADAQVLGVRDLKERYHRLPVGDSPDGRAIEPDDFIWEVCTGCGFCEGCGSTYKRRVEP